MLYYNAYTYTYIYIYTSLSTHTHIYIYIYIHTYIPVSSSPRIDCGGRVCGVRVPRWSYEVPRLCSILWVSKPSGGVCRLVFALRNWACACRRAACAYVIIYIYIYMYIYIYIYTLYVYIYIYTHTHIHTYTHVTLAAARQVTAKRGGVTTHQGSGASQK